MDAARASGGVFDRFSFAGGFAACLRFLKHSSGLIRGKSNAGSFEFKTGLA
jgi:hypothetical protein